MAEMTAPLPLCRDGKGGSGPDAGRKSAKRVVGTTLFFGRPGEVRQTTAGSLPVGGPAHFPAVMPNRLDRSGVLGYDSAVGSSYTNSTQIHCRMVLCDPESQIDFQDSLNP